MKFLLPLNFKQQLEYPSYMELLGLFCIIAETLLRYWLVQFLINPLPKESFLVSGNAVGLYLS